MNRLLNLCTRIGLTFVLGITCFCILRYGNPQWNKYVYIFQSYISPKHKSVEILPGSYSFVHNKFDFPKYGREIIPPKTYNGQWKNWSIAGRLRSYGRINFGKKHGIWKFFHKESGSYIQFEYRDGKLILGPNGNAPADFD